MNRRELLILNWLRANSGWRSLREIGIGALHLSKTGRWGHDGAITGALKKLRTKEQVEFGRGKIPGILEAYRAVGE